MKTYLSPGEQWRRTVNVWLRCANRYRTKGWPEATLGSSSDGVGIVVSACKWTRIGDLLIADFGNGDDRWGWTGVTSKGRILVRFYQSMDRKEGGRIRRLKLPDGVAKLSPLDPAVRACLDSLRAGDVAALQKAPGLSPGG